MNIQEHALRVCNLKEVPDEEERYYNRLNCEKYDALVEFGKEQQEIDIQRAVEWLHNYFCETHRGMTEQGFGLFQMLFEKAMKGE